MIQRSRNGMNVKVTQEYPAPWWFRVLSTLCPDRCREIPEAQDPGRTLLRQFAVIRKYAYVQQFASGEDHDWLHSHPWRCGTIAIGLWGGLREQRLGPRASKDWRAPYIRYMGPNTVHWNMPLGPGHTSIFIGLGRKTDEKWYYRVEKKHWSEHIKKQVKRI